MEKPSIILFGTYAEENLGDDLMLVSQIIQLNKIYNECKIVIFTGDCQITKQMLLNENINLSNIELIYTGRKGLLEANKKGFSKLTWFFKNISRVFTCDLLIIGPGNQTQDVTRKMRFLFFLSRSLLAFIFRTKYAFLGIGYYQIKSPFLKKVFKFFGKRSSFISTRDNGGFKKISKIIENKNITHSLADVSFTYPWEKTTTQQNKKLKIGFTSRIFLKEVFEENISKNYEERYGEFLKHLNKLYDAEFVFFPFYKTKPWDDTVSLKRLLDYSKDKNLKISVSKFKNLKELSKEISSLDVMIAVRYHSCLISVQNLTPVLGISYAHKTKRFMTENGLSDYVINLQDIKKDSLPTIFGKLMENKEKLVKKYIQIIEKEKPLAQKHFQLIEKSIGKKII